MTVGCMDSTPTRRLGSSALQYVSKLEREFISSHSICANLPFACHDPQHISDRRKYIRDQKTIAGNPCGCQKPVLEMEEAQSRNSVGLKKHCLRFKTRERPMLLSELFC